MLIRKLVDGTQPRSMTAQSRRAKVVAVEIWLCILCRWMIAFKNKLTILECGSLQQPCMYYTYDQILESVGDGSDLQQRKGVQTGQDMNQNLVTFSVNMRIESLGLTSFGRSKRHVAGFLSSQAMRTFSKDAIANL